MLWLKLIHVSKIVSWTKWSTFLQGHNELTPQTLGEITDDEYNIVAFNEILTR